MYLRPFVHDLRSSSGKEMIARDSGATFQVSRRITTDFQLLAPKWAGTPLRRSSCHEHFK